MLHVGIRRKLWHSISLNKIACVRVHLPRLFHLNLQENKRLSEPLTVALSDVAELHAHLRGRDKDRLSLANAKARLRVIDEQVCLHGKIDVG